ncbi:MAG: S8 family peptidase [Lachnospiraceae bacterium]|jgi:minor extracellular serine protease Vpr|nr:S8 family peptidase [Lachnospiraceae bacterium]
MPNQKLENLLNLSLEVTPQERARSQELETGYMPKEKSWELIVKYSGSLDGVREMGVQVEELQNEYAILIVPENLIDQVSRLPQIEYVEKPKRLFFAINRAKAASCINILQEPPENLTGKGVLMAVIDSGIDYFHDDFRNEDGTTRILELWDQALDKVFTAAEINNALEAESRAEAREILPSVDGSGHGTSVAGIAAGNGRESEGAYRGVAFESELLVVKLGAAREEGFPRTTELMRGVDFVVRRAVEMRQPLVVNISFGNTYGSHDGTGLLETFLNDIGNYGQTTIVVGSGNEGATAGHVSGNFPAAGSRGGRGTGSAGGERSSGGNYGTVRSELSVAPYETGVSVQLWKDYTDRFTVTLETPSGERLGPLSEQLGPVRFRYRRTQVLVYYGKPGPFSVAQEIYFDFVPDEGNYVESGIWTFILEPQRIVQGRYDFWLPSSAVLNFATRFLESTPDTTLTIPSSAAKVITVGAYNSITDSYADFSGRGFTRMTDQVKPDLCAPGVGLMAPGNGGGYRSVTGTSFAAPVVAGSAALLMQWGIVDGNDPFLYGEKVKAYLRRGARPLPGFEEYPNAQLGWGALCVRDSLPV